MWDLWWVFIAIAAIVVALRMMGTSNLSSALKEMKKTGEVKAVVAAVLATPEGKQPTMWDQAIGTLWRQYDRDEAMVVMMEAARRSDAPVIQFWLKNAMEVEPELANAHFTEEFLTKYFRADVAARCGRVSCCAK